MSARVDPPGWFLAVVGLLLLFSYTFHLGSSPLQGEEQRRCQVALEMIHSGDYIVPHLQGEPYFKKPPMQNWLIVLLSGNRFERVGELPVRWITLLSLAGIAFLLRRLGTSSTGEPDWLPPLVFLTFGTLLNNGWMGEVDPLFSFFVFAALAAFEVGRRSGSPGVQWGLSQALVALGVLTKGLAPLFFYPPVLYLAWRRRDRFPFSTRAFVGGLLSMLAIVGAWLVPFTLLAPRVDSTGTWGSEIASRIDQGAAPLIQHLVSYPLLWLGVLLPWSLYLLRFVSPRQRAELRGLADDDWRALAVAVVGWFVLIYVAVPGVKARYLMPAAPFAAVLIAWLLERSSAALSRAESARAKTGWGWWLFCGALGAGWIAYVSDQGFKLLDAATGWTVLALGLAAIVSVAVVRATGRLSSTVAPFLMLALLYGIASRGVLDERDARKFRGYAEAATHLLSVVDDDRPVICVRGMHRRLAFEVSRRLGRPVGETQPQSGPYYLIAPAESEDPVGGKRRAQSWIYAIWEVPTNPGDPLAPDERLLRAHELYEVQPSNADAALRLARTYAERGRYGPAEALLTRTLADHPGDPRLLRRRGEARIYLGRFRAAAADLEAAVRDSENLPVTVETPSAVFPDTRPKSSLARRIEWIANRLGGGDPTTEGAVAKGPTLRFNAWRLLATAHFLEGKFDEARAAFDRSLEFASTPETTCTSGYWLALSLIRLDRQAEAAALAERMEIGTADDGVPACRVLAVLTTDTPETRPTDDPDLEFGRANRLLRTGDRDAARAILRDVADHGDPTRLITVAARAEIERDPGPTDGTESQRKR